MFTALRRIDQACCSIVLIIKDLYNFALQSTNHITAKLAGTHSLRNSENKLWFKRLCTPCCQSSRAPDPALQDPKTHKARADSRANCL